jgi:hypothetical protein
MKPRFLKITYVSFILSSLFVFPTLALASDTGSPPVKSGITYECGTRTASDGTPIYGECSFDDLIAATLYAINYASLIAIGLVGIVIAWAGFKYMTSEGNPGKRAQANGVLTKAVIGMAFILGAWLIVQFIVKALGINTGAVVF